MTAKVFVFVRGGVVQEVRSDDPLLDVRVMDYDGVFSCEVDSTEFEILGTSYEELVKETADVW